MSLFDLSGIVTSLATHAVTVTRFAADSFGSNGKANARSVASTFTANMNVQPGGRKLDREDLQGFNERDDLVTVFGYLELQNRDRLTIPGLGDFEVERVDVWTSTGTYCEATARKLAAPFEPRS